MSCAGLGSRVRAQGRGSAPASRRTSRETRTPSRSCSSVPNCTTKSGSLAIDPPSDRTRLCYPKARLRSRTFHEPALLGEGYQKDRIPHCDDVLTQVPHEGRYPIETPKKAEPVKKALPAVFEGNGPILVQSLHAELGSLFSFHLLYIVCETSVVANSCILLSGK